MAQIIDARARFGTPRPKEKDKTPYNRDTLEENLEWFERMGRIRKSLERINSLMSELKTQAEQESKPSNSGEYTDD